MNGVGGSRDGTDQGETDSRARWTRLALALAVGAVGGTLFSALSLPVPWLLGPLAATMVASLGSWPVAVPGRLRTVVLTVVGAFIGTSFTPETVARIGDWPWTLGFMVLYVALVTALIGGFLHRFGPFDRISATYAALPGGLTAMVAMTRAAGGDERQVSLAHSLRVVLIVFLVPAVVTLATGTTGADPAALAGPEGPPTTAIDLAVLAAGVAVGIVLARLLRFPTPYLLGAMAASALMHLTGWSHAQLPEPLLLVCFWILGSSVGSRFAGVGIGEVLRVARVSIAAMAIMLGFAALFAAGVSALLQLDYLPVLLAFSPGGVYEMCLIALAFDIDPTFVAFHHLFRFGLLLMVAPIVLPRMIRWIEGRAAARADP